jgi:hypothetical protein
MAHTSFSKECKYLYIHREYIVNLKWKFIYLGRRPSPSPLLSPDVLADVDVVDLKLSSVVLQKF